MKPTELINFRKLSFLLSGNYEGIRSNYLEKETRKKHREAIKELLDFIEYWINKYKPNNQ